MKKDVWMWIGGGLVLAGGIAWLLAAQEEAMFGSDEYEEQTTEDLTAPPPFTQAAQVSGTLSPASLWQSASKYIGAPWTYRQGGVGDDNTIDCSGLPFRAARDLGVSVERRASLQAAKSSPLDEATARQTAGSLVFFHSPKNDGVYHVEISTGDGRIFGSQTSRKNPSRPSLTFSSWGSWERWGSPPSRVSFGTLNTG